VTYFSELRTDISKMFDVILLSRGCNLVLLVCGDVSYKFNVNFILS